MTKSKIASKFFIGIVFIFLYFPLFIMVLYSFNSGKTIYSFEGFSTKWYGYLFENEDMIEAIIATIIIAILATIISVVIGTLTAIALSRTKKIAKDILLQINNLPIVNPDIITAVSLLLIFIFMNIERGYTTMLMAHIIFCTPYVIITVLPRLKSLDPNLIEAALDLGATPTYALRKVLIPQLWIAIAGSAGIAFTMSFDDFLISYFTSGTSGTNISIYLYTYRRPMTPAVYSLSTIIMVSIAFIIIIRAILYRNKDKLIKE